MLVSELTKAFSNNNRFSMPATGYRGSSQRLSTFSAAPGANTLTASNFYLDGDDEQRGKASNPVDLSSPDAKLLMQMTNSAVDDGFPTLRSDLTSGGVSKYPALKAFTPYELIHFSLGHVLC